MKYLRDGNDANKQNIPMEHAAGMFTKTLLMKLADYCWNQVKKLHSN
jgi:hypothetical protein